MQKYAFLKKNGFDWSFISNLRSIGNRLVYSTSKKHQTFEKLTKVDFLRFF